MALSANSVFEVRTAGNDTNGGGFVTGASGTDYSQQDNKNTATGTDDSTTDAVANGTTTITSATANFGTSIVGNIIYLQGGTGALTATWRQVTARTNSTTITVDSTVATGTGITMNIGGALASPGGFGVVPIVANNTCWIKAGTYTVTSTSAVAGGCISKSLALRIEGYNSTRGDLGTPPVIIANGVITGFTLIALNAAGAIVTNLSLDGNSRTTSKGLNIRGTAYKCKFANFTNNAISAIAAFAYAIDCYATGCTNQPVFGQAVNCYGCVATANTVTPFQGGGSNSIIYDRCISYGNTGATTDGFVSALESVSMFNCVSYGNGRHGFNISSAGVYLLNCIAETNTGTGFVTNNNPTLWVACAAYGNGTNFTLGTSNLAYNLSSVTGVSSFFTNAASGDFSLNNTASAGAAARAVASPTPSFQGGLTNNYLDIGAAQHQDSGGGGGSSAHSAVF